MIYGIGSGCLDGLSWTRVEVPLNLLGNSGYQLSSAALCDSSNFTLKWKDSGLVLVRGFDRDRFSGFVVITLQNINDRYALYDWEANIDTSDCRV